MVNACGGTVRYGRVVKLMTKYSIFGVEEVYDAFDEYEHANALPPFCISASSVKEAETEGMHLLNQYLDYNQRYSREAFYSTGTFIPLLIQIRDELGNVLIDHSRKLIRSWPFQSDERNLIPDNLPTQICFLSYSRRDISFELILNRYLSTYSLLPWLDLERPDMPNGRPESDDIIKNRIMDGINSADVFLITISDDSVASKWVEFEACTALESNRLYGKPKIIGLQISQITTSNSPWLKKLQECQYLLDISGWKGDATRELQSATGDELNALLPSALDRAFKGEL